MMREQPRYLIGVDVGGTFTDVLCLDTKSQALLSAKVPSLPGRQWEGVVGALAELGIEPGAIRAFVHGTTIATNALLERKGAKTALVTTEGFRDTLEIGRTRRLTGGLFDIRFVRAAPLVDRPLRLEVAERVAADGTVLVDAAGIDFSHVAETLRREGVESVAVGFLNAYANDANERAAAAALQDLLDGVPVCRSTAVASERGEFHRFSTCVLNAYLTPVVVAYLERLAAELAAHGVAAPVNVMGSNGGAMTLDQAAGFAAGTFLSGPVGGVGGAVRVCEMAGIRDCITFDMGGTSTDVALIHNLAPRISHDNQIDACPLQVAQLDIHTIGAGGGSVAWVREDGALEVGPKSAGALPGPACYGRGGTEPTISDANLVLGRLPTERSLAGGLRLDGAAAEAAFAELSEALGGGDPVTLADGVIRIAVAKMAGAVREVSVHRGFDPRDFALLGFGGAGPMHVFLVAEELAIPNVIVPRFPGHLSALGQLLADARHDYVRAWGGRLGALTEKELRRVAAGMQDEAAATLDEEGFAVDRRHYAFAVDARYVGQSYTLAVGVDPDAPGWDGLRRAFAAAHELTFGHADLNNDVEIVNIRLVALGIVDKPALVFAQEQNGDPAIETRKVWFDDGWCDCPVLDRARLPAGCVFGGPAIVEEAGGTSVIPPGWRVEVHESGALICRRDGRFA
ncbi:MAG: hydantoinase/oxoprolinase family protein [Alphaproteobacteria bacterium]|nr:hydantoinase/oxoprolinase family protein [Alphaproteobacteria bacterium]